MGRVRDWRGAALLLTLTLLQACGGGGGGSTPAPAAATAPVADASASGASNVQPISVDAGLGGNVNLVFTSLTLCAPGNGANCQTIDNIVVDSGSSGLRILSSALAPTLALAQQTDANGGAVVECAFFVDGYTWGPVKLADLKIAGERADSLPIQVIGDAGFPNAPATCTGTGPSKNSVQDLRANGILGLSVFRQDCGSACAQPNNRGMYYTCTSTACRQVPLALERQVQNPVSLFAVNNNGMILRLPAVPAAGAARIDGSLVFGIGTQANNGLGAATVVGVDANSGNFTTVYKGRIYIASFLDSGSNGLFFQDSTPLCGSASVAPGFYCPAATIDTFAVIQGTNRVSVSVDFSIANAAALFAANPNYTAFSNLGAPFTANNFDWGLPFFYGRSVYTAIERAGTPAGPGPYVAF